MKLASIFRTEDRNTLASALPSVRRVLTTSTSMEDEGMKNRTPPHRPTAPPPRQAAGLLRGIAFGALAVTMLVSGFVSACTDSAGVEHEPATESFAEFLASAPSLRPGDIGVLGGQELLDYDHLKAQTVWEGDDEVTVYGILPVADNPGMATAMFLASPVASIEPDQFGILARSAWFEGMEMETGPVEVSPHGSDGWSYGVMPMPTSPLALAFIFAEQADGECQLGRDFFDKPGAWDFIRGSDKADDWGAYGDCVEALKLQTANSDCFVASRLIWDSGGEYWDSKSWLECPE